MSEAWIWLGTAAFAGATVGGWRRDQRRTGTFSTAVFTLLLAGVCAVAFAIAARWLQTGYGPVLTLHEVLLSNVFSLGLIVTIFYCSSQPTRLGLAYALPVIVLIAVWALSADKDSAQLPATFDSPWLWLHVGFGKIFLGALLIALGLAIAGIVGSAAIERELIDSSVWRFASLAFVFDSSMLLTGAMWANDAWGRYWNWDPVETWALLTWLALALCLHARLAWRIPLPIGWAMIVGVFVLAFLTLFGMPFLSLGPHKGIL